MKDTTTNIFTDENESSYRTLKRMWIRSSSISVAEVRAAQQPKRFPTPAAPQHATLFRKSPRKLNVFFDDLPDAHISRLSSESPRGDAKPSSPEKFNVRKAIAGMFSRVSSKRSTSGKISSPFLAPTVMQASPSMNLIAGEEDTVGSPLTLSPSISTAEDSAKLSEKPEKSKTLPFPINGGQVEKPYLQLATGKAPQTVMDARRQEPGSSKMLFRRLTGSLRDKFEKHAKQSVAPGSKHFLVKTESNFDEQFEEMFQDCDEADSEQ